MAIRDVIVESEPSQAIDGSWAIYQHSMLHGVCRQLSELDWDVKRHPDLRVKATPTFTHPSFISIRISGHCRRLTACSRSLSR